MQCAKCHNHPFERWTQDDYYSMAAFFARVKQKKDTGDGALANVPGAEMIYSDRAGEVIQPRIKIHVLLHAQIGIQREFLERAPLVNRSRRGPRRTLTVAPPADNSNDPHIP